MAELLKPAITVFISIEELRATPKWTKVHMLLSTPKSPVNKRLTDLFEIKRGIATGANSFFMLSCEEADALQLPKEFLKPVLPQPRYLKTREIEADEAGNPLLEKQLFLLSCDLAEDLVKSKYPTLWKYLDYGKENGINKGYIRRHHSPWYSQEKRPPAPILFPIMGRSKDGKHRTYRFILNHSAATATNVYLMLYPKTLLKEALKRDPDLLTKIWTTLNNIPTDVLLREGRVYGGGLYKLEPRELANVPADELMPLILKSLDN